MILFNFCIKLIFKSFHKNSFPIVFIINCKHIYPFLPGSAAGRGLFYLFTHLTEEIAPSASKRMLIVFRDTYNVIIASGVQNFV